MPPAAPEFSSIARDWVGETVAIVAAGPSLADFDFTRLRGLCKVIAVKQIIFEMPWADLGFGLDIQWIARFKDRLAACATPLLLAVPKDEHLHAARPAVRPGLAYVERRRGDFLSDDPAAVLSGGNSGFGALSIPYLKGAGPFWFLFGFDYRTTGKLHHYSNERYPWAQKHGHWSAWARRFDNILPQIRRAGVNVINVCPDSAITAFPKVTHDAAMEHLYRLRSEGDGRIRGGAIEHPASPDAAGADLRVDQVRA